MWDADPSVWASHAPVLFPVIGAIKNGFVKYKGEAYAVPRHGIVRNNPNVQLVSETIDSLIFGLTSDAESLEIYPFQFDFRVTYKLDGANIEVIHEVTNQGDGEMLFSLGGHPAFRCPLRDGEVYEDYYLEFETVEDAPTWLLEANGLVGNQTKPVLEHTNILHLHSHLFDADALIFKSLQSKKVALRSTKSAQVITVAYPDFPYLGVWAKPGGHFVCIEPWLGIADHADSDQDFEKKEGILKLAASETFRAKFTIGIHE